MQRMNAQGSFSGIALIVLVVALLIGALLLLIVGTGVFSSSDNDEPILNTEFLPLGRSGMLVVKEFEFCRQVTEDFSCLLPTERFFSGDEVHFRFVVQTSHFENQVLLLENYRLLAPSGSVLLEVDEKNNFHFDVRSSRGEEQIRFKDYFVLGRDDEEGVYSLQLFLENPLLGKETQITKQFAVEERREDHD